MNHNHSNGMQKNENQCLGFLRTDLSPSPKIQWRLDQIEYLFSLLKTIFTTIYKRKNPNFLSISSMKFDRKIHRRRERERGRVGFVWPRPEMGGIRWKGFGDDAMSLSPVLFFYFSFLALLEVGQPLLMHATWHAIVRWCGLPQSHARI